MAIPLNRFAAGERRRQARLGRLRDVVRQELVTRQLREHLPDPPARVLDIGCGQGTQALRLARRGHRVTCLDASAEMLARLESDLATEPPETRALVRIVRADAEDAAELFGPDAFDVALCHGVLMYLTDPEPLVRVIADSRPGRRRA